MTKRERLRAELLALEGDPRPFLTAHSNLPGPRANLELIDAFADVAPRALALELAGEEDEYLAACGVAALGRVAGEGDPAAIELLRERANDERWRVREAVAIALQRIGDADPSALAALAREWAHGSQRERRAAAAGVCEPRLLRTPDRVAAALDVLDAATAGAADPVLVKGLSYCWSVAVAAAPELGRPRMERWLRDDDPTVRRIMRENLRKARLARAEPEWTARWRAEVEGQYRRGR